jgi:hypothetical protein
MGLIRNPRWEQKLQHFFKIVLYRCFDPIRHNKYIFDIPICYNLYLSATLKQFLTEFAITDQSNRT